MSVKVRMMHFLNAKNKLAEVVFCGHCQKNTNLKNNIGSILVLMDLALEFLPVTLKIPLSPS